MPVAGTRSKAERDLHEVFGRVALADHVAIHSLALADHPYKRWGEIDFLIVGPPGILALEVKGGGVDCHDSIWEFEDRNGVVHRRAESPMHQASSALMALREWLLEQLPRRAVEDLSFGWGVVFPDTIFSKQSPEWDPACVADRRIARDAVATERWLVRLFKHWQVRNDRPQEIPPIFLRRLLETIRPEFELAPSLGSLVGRALEASNRLTANQLELLDAVLDNQRILALGGAGTGKTFVAAELVRRRHSAMPDERLAVLVPWPSAALPFRGAIPDHVPVLVGTSNAPPPVDYVVVDEAQDFMNADGLAVLDSAVRGGLSSGQWAAFMDRNAQRGLRMQFDPAALAILADARPATLNLRRNLRNSHEIAEFVAEVTGADVGVPGGGHGPDVRIEILPTDAEFARRAARTLRQLRSDGATPDEVVILSWLDPTEVARALDGDPWPARALAGGPDLMTSSGAVRVCHPSDFQGLEAIHVILGPVPDDETGGGISALYVGATRARADLTFCAGRDVAARLATGFEGDRRTR